MQNLKITIIQPDITWENSSANLNKYSESINKTEPTDVIVLPEMFTTGFSMNPKKISEKIDGISVNWMKKVAKEKDAAVVGSLIIEENNQFFNRALWVLPNGEIQKYDKRHLFSMGQEADQFSAGTEKLIVEYKGWRFCPLICYDLRFPVWSRNRNEYDVLIYLANWPAARHFVWKNLLTARAIENQTYCIGVNRVGTDGTGLKYSGDSALVSPKGFAEYLGEKETIKTFEISYSELHAFRNSFPVLNDGDDFRLHTE
jgi:predicted amidohydrolase